MYIIKSSKNAQTEFLCETVEDLKDLPPSGLGDSAFVIATSEVYMCLSTGEWVKI